MAEGRNLAREQSDLGTISQAVSQSCLTSEPLPARTFGILSILKAERASPAAQLVKNPPAPQESRVQFLGWEDPLEKERRPAPVLWPGDFHGLCAVYGTAKSRTGLSDFHSHRAENHSCLS